MDPISAFLLSVNLLILIFGGIGGQQSQSGGSYDPSDVFCA